MKTTKLAMLAIMGGVFLPLTGQALSWGSLCSTPTSLLGVGAWDPPAHQIVPGNAACNAATNMWVTMWVDPGMAAATAVDYLATRKHNERTIDAEDAIDKLEKALEGGDGGESVGGESTSSDSSIATVYTTDMILTQIEVTDKSASAEQVFTNTREAIQDYLFETPASDVKGECTQSDKDCATARQNEWLLASVALASATADKILDQTAKQNVQDGKTAAEQTPETTKDTAGTGGGATTLTDHFQELASNFNAEKSPTGLYNRMADIVLDTHRHINDANALLGRDLEAQGLRIVTETGPVLLNGAETEE